MPLTEMFTRKYYEDGVAASADISCMELMDLLMALAGNHYVVQGIYTQWAMHSDKAQFGAHAGGARITTRHFSVPCLTPPDRAETVIKTLAKHKPHEVGDYFVNEFINPILDCVPEGPMKAAVERSQRRFMGVHRAAVSEEFLASIETPPMWNGVPMEQTGKDWSQVPSARSHQFGRMVPNGAAPVDHQIRSTLKRDLDYFRNWSAKGMLFFGVPDDQEDALFYIDWFGLSFLEWMRGEIQLPHDYAITVKDVRDRLAQGEELSIPPRDRARPAHDIFNPDHHGEPSPTDGVDD
ncbi:hypothetical protein D3C78_1052800 [compost metagenome]